MESNRPGGGKEGTPEHATHTPIIERNASLVIRFQVRNVGR